MSTDDYVSAAPGEADKQVSQPLLSLPRPARKIPRERKARENCPSVRGPFWADSREVGWPPGTPGSVDLRHDLRDERVVLTLGTPVSNEIGPICSEPPGVCPQGNTGRTADREMPGQLGPCHP